MELLVNIDHIATLRNARGEGVPDPTEAAQICENAGAAGIVFHLREDRRHIKDHDVYSLKDAVKGKLDFEMAATDEMIGLCEKIRPEICTLVPESREELTTEGGLNMRLIMGDYRKRVVPRLLDTGTMISLFVDPNPDDIQLCKELGVQAIELHTGRYANAQKASVVEHELERLREAAELAHSLGLIVNAGHGLNYVNTTPFIRTVPHLADISIGHALVTHAVFHGLENSVREMVRIIKEG
ncbi:MAG: pyridoxine 5'-phosphate synthase [Bacteroidetes bacterium]|nr:pyridoxine 5'-phosphate synthase [Bacteroidota bacterium]MCH8525415.1 pyridoxine 5'-phosphate synthase [Balneolales bacterium]